MLFAVSVLLLVLPDRADGNIIKTIGSIADSCEDLAGNLTPVGCFLKMSDRWILFQLL